MDVIFYMSFLGSLFLVALGIRKKNTIYIMIAALLSIIATILSLWSYWKLIILLPFFCVVAILGVKFSKLWFLLFVAGTIIWLLPIFLN